MMKSLLAETLEQDGDYYFRVAYSILATTEEAEEAVQDAFVAALNNPAAFQAKSSIKTWLTSILRHKCIDRLRAHCSKRRHIVPEELSDLFLEDGHWKPHLVPSENWGRDPEGEFETKQLLRFINDCIKLMTAQQRLLILLSEVEGLPREEVCNKASLSPSNVAVVLFRARAALRKCVDQKVR